MNSYPNDRAAVAPTPPRFDLYAVIHKAMRAMMADALLAAGRLDVHDEAEVAATAGRIGGLMAFCGEHLVHENSFVHPAIEAVAPGASAAIAQEHEEHAHHTARLAQAAAALPGLPAHERQAAAHQLYLDLALFIADNFRHMHVEETVHNGALWAHYSDAQLAQVHGSLVASIPPPAMLSTARWMLPSMSHQERCGMLGDMRRHAPPPAFAAVLDVARTNLPPSDWAKLSRGLGLAA